MLITRDAIKCNWWAARQSNANRPRFVESSVSILLEGIIAQLQILNSGRTPNHETPARVQNNDLNWRRRTNNCAAITTRNAIPIWNGQTNSRTFFSPFYPIRMKFNLWGGAHPFTPLRLAAEWDGMRKGAVRISCCGAKFELNRKWNCALRFRMSLLQHKQYECKRKRK